MQKTKIILSTAGIALGIALGIIAQPVISSDNMIEQIEKFRKVLFLTTNNYVDEVDPAKLVEAGVKGMLSELDPHSIYIPPAEKKKTDEDFQGSFDGIGVSFDVIQDTITVIEPIGGGPSAKLGILAGDKIVKIDGESAIKLSSDDVIKKLKGSKGTKVTVHIKRPEERDLLVFDIIRDKVPIYTVDASFILDGTNIGYIRVNRFAATTHEEVLKATRELKSQGMKRMILDLRWNPGGYLDQAVKLADEFIPGGKKIVYTKGRRSEFDNDFLSTSAGELEKIPLIVMVNENSASASEIVAGAIQDLDRGLIVGETSFGKGLVQQQYDLEDGSAFRLTTSKYYTPSGRSIQRSYKDKQKYYALEGRSEPEEGDNLEHKGDADSSRPLYKTSSGRKVYGGGGIVPDYVVKTDTLTDLTVSLIRKNVMTEFVDSYLSSHGKELRAHFSNNFRNYLQEFAVDETMIESLKNLAAKKQVKWEEIQYITDTQAIKINIKSQIARSLWGANESAAASVQHDRQLQKAMGLFPEATKIARLN